VETAESEDWYRRGEPIFVADTFYYPAGPEVFFDGNVMVRIAAYGRVPLYADVTVEPYSVVLVPIAGNRMKPYERRRAGDLAGTVGSRTPSFPVQRDSEVRSLEPGGIPFDVAYGPFPLPRPAPPAVRWTQPPVSPPDQRGHRHHGPKPREAERRREAERAPRASGFGTMAGDGAALAKRCRCPHAWSRLASTPDFPCTRCANGSDPIAFICPPVTTWSHLTSSWSDTASLNWWIGGFVGL
jgi:hypothetical protein